MIHLLALLARAGHGKTTIANYMRDTYGVSIVSLAAPLKRIAQVTMGFSDEELWGTQEQKEAFGEVRNAAGDPMSARIFLQRLGTEGIRKHLGPRTWCEALAYNIARDYTAKQRALGHATIHEAGDAVYVVDDVRFINEIEFIDELKGRPGLPKFFGTSIKLVCTDAPPSGDDNHPSEREVDLMSAHLIDAVVTSRRGPIAEDKTGNLHGGGFGTTHLIEQVEAALALPHLANLRGALNRSAIARAAAERTARLEGRIA